MWVENPNPEYQRLRSALTDTLVEVALLEAQRAAILNRLSQVEARLETLRARVARAETELENLSQALTLARDAYLALSRKATDLRIELATSQNSLAQVIAPAYPIYERVWPRRGLILALALVLGVFLAFGVALLRMALETPSPTSRPAEG